MVIHSDETPPADSVTDSADISASESVSDSASESANKSAAESVSDSASESKESISVDPPSASKVLIVGAGAAGLTAAIFAAAKGASVTVLERTDKPGKKILMSGGTRCNVLPVTMSMDDYITDSSPNLLKRIFRSWSVEDCRTWFEQDLDLELSCELESNKWFPTTNDAKDVRDALLNRALDLGVDFRYNTAINALRQTDDGWTVSDERGHTYSAHAVIVATGGLSVPTIGTDGMGHRFLRQLGVEIRPTYAALTPVTGPHPGTENLAGISLTVQLTATGPGIPTLKANREGFLFTHKGFSGPAILDLSHYITRYFESRAQTATEVSPMISSEGATNALLPNERPKLLVNWTGETEEIWKARLTAGHLAPRQVIREHLPSRLAQALCREMPYADRRLAELPRADRQDLLRLLTAYPLPWASHEGYRKAEVTGGGVPLEAINTATMELKSHPGLFLCGEILDVFGRIGGFNFYWAWVTGRLAGLSSTTAGSKGLTTTLSPATKGIRLSV